MEKQIEEPVVTDLFGVPVTEEPKSKYPVWTLKELIREFNKTQNEFVDLFMMSKIPEVNCEKIIPAFCQFMLMKYKLLPQANKE